MKFKTIVPLAGSFFVAAALFIAVFYWLNSPPRIDDFSNEEAVKTVEALYNGKVRSSKQADGTFTFELENSAGIYEIVMDEKDGTIVSVSKIKLAPMNEKRDMPEKDANENLTEEDIYAILQNYSTGKITSVQLEKKDGNPIYIAELKEKGKTVFLKMDGKNGKILSKEEKADTLPLITEEKAIAVAKNQFNGEVEDLELETGGNFPYYLIEIESKDREAVIQIHGITGDILSITWEEDEEDDEEDDD